MTEQSSRGSKRKGRIVGGSQSRQGWYSHKWEAADLELQSEKKVR